MQLSDAHGLHQPDDRHVEDDDFHVRHDLGEAYGRVDGARDDDGGTQACMQAARSNTSRRKADRYRYRHTRSCIRGLLHSSPTKARRAQRLQTVSSFVRV